MRKFRGKKFSERGNPILNEIFLKYSGSDLSKELGISRRAVSYWKYVPLKYVDKIALLCDMDSEEIRQNTISLRDKLSEFIKLDNSILGTSLSQCEEALFVVKDSINRSKEIITQILSDPEVSENTKKELGIAGKLVSFIEINPKVKKEFTHYIMRQVRLSR